MKKSIIALAMLSASSSAFASQLTNGFEVGLNTFMFADRDIVIKGSETVSNIYSLDKFTVQYEPITADLSGTSSAIVAGYTWFYEDKMLNINGSYALKSDIEASKGGSTLKAETDMFSIGLDYGKRLRANTPTYFGLSVDLMHQTYDSTSSDSTGHLFTEIASISDINTGLFVKHYFSNNIWMMLDAGITFNASSEYKSSDKLFAGSLEYSFDTKGEVDSISPYIGLTIGGKF